MPAPEEIFEAYREGFIDFRDYRELLEITRHEFLSPGDSAFLRQFPDLMVGLSSHPLVEFSGLDDSVDHLPQSTTGPVWRHAVLFRQYHRFEKDAEYRRLYRLQGDYQQVRVYGEYEYEYSGRKNWHRRSLSYTVGSDSENRYSVVLGNFRDRFGMGLLYGYHGQLVSPPEDATGSEMLLYPDYGGSNGIYVAADRRSGCYRFVFDTDRDETFVTRLIGVSLSRRIKVCDMAVSAGRGEIRNRAMGRSYEISLFSVMGKIKSNGLDLTGELAVGEDGSRLPTAGAVRLGMRRGRMRMRTDAWWYASSYPSMFSGGPSSRRSRSVDIMEIGYSYSDRYRNERGIVLGTRYPIVKGVTLNSSMMYASRGIDDDRVETRIGIGKNIASTIRLGIDGYWRSDELHTGESMRRRLQLELVHIMGNMRNRFVLGRRFDTDPDRGDYVMVLSSHVRDRWGKASAIIKVDRIGSGDWAGRYLYATAQYEMRLSRHISTYIKYSHRHLRDDPDGDYAIIRWDVRWVIQ